VRFGKRTYVGDPLNVIRLFNEKEVDEIFVLDIDATSDRRTPDLGFLRELASECFMPLAYGGGITSLEQCEQISRAGIEKIVLGTSSENKGFVSDVSKNMGSQSVVACVDVFGSGVSARCFTRSGKSPINIDLIRHCVELQEAGAGEIVLQSIDRDGTRSGYNVELIRMLASQLAVPLVALGGAGEATHLVEALKVGASAAASGSAFIFVGRLRAVLINSPDPAAIEMLIRGGS
jgi:cyclase